MNESTTTPPANGEIDLIKLSHTIWSGRGTILRTMLAFALAGVIFALVSPVRYQASTTIVPQLPDAQSKMGGLSGLAAMAGINLNMVSSSEITPVVYPEITSSVPFQLELMQTPLKFREIGQAVSLYEYYTNHSRSALETIMQAVGSSSPEVPDTAVTGYPIRLTRQQKKVQKKLDDILSIEYKDEEGYVILTCEMPEALPAAQLAQRAQELLQQYITEFKIEKAQATFRFTEKRYNEVKLQYQQVQAALAAFQDRNRNMASAVAQTELVRLKNDYNLAYEVYSELAKQLEQARIQVKEDTPVFTVIRPVSVPLEKSKPLRSVIVLLAIFAGSIAGTGIVFVRKHLDAVKKQWADAR